MEFIKKHYKALLLLSISAISVLLGVFVYNSIPELKYNFIISLVITTIFFVAFYPYETLTLNKAITLVFIGISLFLIFDILIKTNDFSDRILLPLVEISVLSYFSAKKFDYFKSILLAILVYFSMGILIIGIQLVIIPEHNNFWLFYSAIHIITTIIYSVILSKDSSFFFQDINRKILQK